MYKKSRLSFFLKRQIDSFSNFLTKNTSGAIKTKISICISSSRTAARRWKTLLSFKMLIKWNYPSRAAEIRGNPVQWGSNWSPLIRLPLLWKWKRLSLGDSCCLGREIGVEVGIYFSSFLWASTCHWIEFGGRGAGWGDRVERVLDSERFLWWLRLDGADFPGFCWHFDGNLSSLTKVSCQLVGLNWTFCHLIALYFLIEVIIIGRRRKEKECDSKPTQMYCRSWNRCYLHIFVFGHLLLID